MWRRSVMDARHDWRSRIRATESSTPHRPSGSSAKYVSQRCLPEFGPHLRARNRPPPHQRDEIVPSLSRSLTSSIEPLVPVPFAGTENASKTRNVSVDPEILKVTRDALRERGVLLFDGKVSMASKPLRYTCDE